MLKQISLLFRMQCCNLFGWNEFRHTRDFGKKKRFITMSIVWLFVLGMILSYVIAFSVGMSRLGMANILPVYLYTTVSVLILILYFFKAGSILFSLNTYEMLSSLPFSKAAIVISRFLEMYIMSFFWGLIILTPGLIIYSHYEVVDISSVLFMVIGLVFLPLIPLTLASIIGAVIKAISSRIRYKNVCETVLMLLFIIVFLIGSTGVSAKLEKMDESAIKNLVELLSEKIGEIYLPAMLFQRSLEGKVFPFIILTVCSFVVFIAFVALLQIKYQDICIALNSSEAKNNYKMKRLKTNSVVFALWKKEWKRYISSGTYVTNTIIGYVMIFILAIVIFVGGKEKTEEMIGIQGIIEYALPFLFALICSMISVTSCSISMEGKNYWMLKTLPIRAKDIFKAKILMNLSLAAPFVLVSSLMCCFSIKTSLLQSIWLVCIPMVYMCTNIVLGLAVNLKLYVLDWDNEVRVVKQSASVLISMLISVVLCVLLGALVLLQKIIDMDCAMGIVLTGMIIALCVLYSYVERQELP